MDSFPSVAAFVTVAFAAALACGLTYLARFVAPRIGLCDHPDAFRKLHAKATPLMGGVAVWIALAAAWCVWRIVGAHAGPYGASWSQWPLLLLLSAGLMCLLGVCDDKWSIAPRTKFFCQILICIPFVCLAPISESVEIFGAQWRWGIWGCIFSVWWLVACVNAVNLLDGMDGVACSVGAVIAMAASWMAFAAGDAGVGMFALLFAGSLFGFLGHNRPPAKIFLGDAGSLVIGLVVGALSLQVASLGRINGAEKTLSVAPLLAMMCLPLFDTVMAILRRKLQGQSIAAPDRKHIHHRLRDRGLSPWTVLSVIIGLTLIGPLSAIIAVQLHVDNLPWAVCVALVMSMIAGRVFGYDEASHLLTLTLTKFRSQAQRSEEQETLLRIDDAHRAKHRSSASQGNSHPEERRRAA